MKLIRTEDAVGQVLCHDITQIIKGVTKDAVFRKGHIIREQDIPVLLRVGKEHIYIWENNENMLHENDAADVLRAICQGEHMHASEAKEGKIELIADIDGLLMVNLDGLRRVNSLGEMMIATRPSGFVVKKGEKLCGTRIIPLVIEKEKMQRAKEAAGEKPLIQLYPLKKKTFGVVTTGSEVAKGLIQDTFTDVIVEKLGEYGCTMTAHVCPGDDAAVITQTIQNMLANGCDMVFCTGGMSVDPDDRTPLAIRNTGAQIVSYGAPVLPGAMFLAAYMPDRAVRSAVLPGCVMYARRTIPRSGSAPACSPMQPVTAEWLAGLGNGGLCLNCADLPFPELRIWKGCVNDGGAHSNGRTSTASGQRRDGGCGRKTSDASNGICLRTDFHE